MGDALFEPKNLLDNEASYWSFDQVPVYKAFAALVEGKLTGVLSVYSGDLANNLYFREGLPVGVKLVDVCAPLGQLLLELGHINSATFVETKQNIDDEGRLPGQVYVEIGAIDATLLKEVLHVQADRKARRFVELCHGQFEFSRGLSFLTGFAATQISPDLLIFLAIERHFPESEREGFLKDFGSMQLMADKGLNAPLDVFGFGMAEERFLSRMVEWHSIDELDKFGTLTRPQISLILKFLHVRHLLKQRPAVEDLPTVSEGDRAQDVFATLDGSGYTPRSIAAAEAFNNPIPAPKKPEKTERVSMPAAGWSDPKPAREERTEIDALPSVLVDFDALEDDED